MNSIQYKVTFEEELDRVIIHGILHLLGYKDKSKNDKSLMKDAEDRSLEKLKLI
jgi:rRNA maturation RNase YbeY